MKLSIYLKRHDLDAKSFALQIGVSPSTIWRIVKLGAVPRMSLARKIKLETGGKVSYEDHLPPKRTRARVS